MLVRIGDKSFSDGIEAWRSDPEGEPNRKGYLVLGLQSFPNNVDLGSQCQVFEDPSDPASVVFTGFIESVEVDNNSLTVVLGTPALLIEEQGLGAISFGLGDVRDLTWSLLRLAGVQSDRMQFQGMTMKNRQFEVSCPLLGLDIEEQLLVGGVVIGGARELQNAVNDLTPGPKASEEEVATNATLIKRFNSASAWAWVQVSAPTLDEAEAIGVRDIERAVSWIRLLARNSRSAVPDGVQRRYRRLESTSARPRLSNVVHVRSLDGMLRWLRDTDLLHRTHDIKGGSLDLTGLGAVPNPTDHELWRAIRLWAQATDSGDLHAKIILLWQSVELLVKRTKVKNMFSTQFRDKVVKTFFGELSPEQRERLREVLGQANNPPLMARVRRYLDGRSLDVTELEIGNLSDTRSIRNDLEHGGVPSVAQQEVVDSALRLVASMLLDRCHEAKAGRK